MRFFSFKFSDEFNYFTFIGFVIVHESLNELLKFHSLPLVNYSIQKIVNEEIIEIFIS